MPSPPDGRSVARGCVERALARARVARTDRRDPREPRLRRTISSSSRAARPDVVVLPKVESPDELAGCRCPAEAQIETARGLVECERIAAAPGLEALVLGPGDLAASLGVPELTIGDGAHVELRARPGRSSPPAPSGSRPSTARTRARRPRRAARERAPLAGARLRRQVVHPPGAGRRVQRGLRADAGRGRAGPAHPRRSTVSRAVDGEMVDEANRRMAEAILARVPRDTSLAAQPARRPRPRRRASPRAEDGARRHGRVVARRRARRASGRSSRRSSRSSR